MLSTVIQKIANASTGTEYVFTSYVPCELTMGRYDVSMSSAGRDEAGNMHKESIGVSNKYMLKFQNIDTATVKAICNIAEINEYINVTIVDPVEGSSPDYLVTRTYYVGDRNISLYSAYADVWSELSFDLIERGVH